MKKIWLLSILIVFVFLSSIPLFAIDRETLWSKLTYSNSPKELDAIALQNLSLVEEILFLSDFQRYNDSARLNAMQILEIAVWKGQLSKEKYFDIMLRFLNQIPSLVNPKVLQDTKGITIGHLESFSRGETLSATFVTFSLLGNSMLNARQIKTGGILNSLAQKVSNAKEILDKRGPDAKNTATNKIQAAISECEAQRGKNITPDGADIISGYLKSLVTKIQTTN